MQAIVVGYDGSATAASAVREAGEIATAFGAALHLVAAVDDQAVRNGMISTTEQAAAVAQARDANNFLIGTSESNGGLAEVLSAVTTHTEVCSGDPSRCLIDYAGKVGAQLIVVGNRRTQGVRRLLGSVAVDVLRHAECSVYVAHTV